MKVCSICDKNKEDVEFSKRYNKLQPYCRSCNRIKQKEHYKNNKEYYKSYSLETKWKLRRNALMFVMEYAKDGCVLCGELDFRCLDFDHIDPTTKDYEISKLVSGGYGIDRIKQELEKCRVLCANCHRKHTANMMAHYANVLTHIDKKISIQDFDIDACS